MLDAVHSLFGGLSGILVGFVLGLVGGGGSILAVPLMVYVVGARDPYAAIGTRCAPQLIGAAADQSIARPSGTRMA
jgi:uncharacterized protein